MIRPMALCNMFSYGKRRASAVRKAPTCMSVRKSLNRTMRSKQSTVW